MYSPRHAGRHDGRPGRAPQLHVPRHPVQLRVRVLVQALLLRLLCPGPVRGGDVLDTRVRGLPGRGPGVLRRMLSTRMARSTSRARAPAGHAGRTGMNLRPDGCWICGYGWWVGNQPAYYASVLGCPPFMSAPPYANYTKSRPCCNLHFAFDTGLIGHGSGVGYAGFGGTGNFGFYGLSPMMHKPSTADLPPFPRPQWPGTGPPQPAPCRCRRCRGRGPEVGASRPAGAPAPAPRRRCRPPAVPGVKKEKPKKEEKKEGRRIADRARAAGDRRVLRPIAGDGDR